MLPVQRPFILGAAVILSTAISIIINGATSKGSIASYCAVVSPLHALGRRQGACEIRGRRSVGVGDVDGAINTRRLAQLLN